MRDARVSLVLVAVFVFVAVLVLVACDANPDDADGGADAAGRDGGSSDAQVVDTGVLRDAMSADASPIDGGDAATGDSGVSPCTLTDSAPIVADTDGMVISRVRIDADGVPAIRVSANGVTIRDVHVTHRNGPGIAISGADDVTIENVVVEYLGAPAAGANPSENHVNIDVYDSARLRVDRARLVRGSSGIYLVQSPASVLRFIEGEDFRGPFPRGQLVQWNNSDDGLLEDFSVVNPAGSWPEDNVNIYQTNGVVVRRGLIDGNNSPSGVGVIFDGGESVGRVEDVDAVHMGNGCFSAYDGGDGSVFLRTRCRDNICTDQGRGSPASNALMWAGQPGLSALRIESSTYAAACNPGNIVWPRDSFAVVDLVEAEFTPRAPLDLRFCWE